MTERRPPGVTFESWVDRRIREAPSLALRKEADDDYAADQVVEEWRVRR